MQNSDKDKIEEYNPRLQFDAFTGGIENGGLRSQNSIKMIACYILANAGKNITAEHIVKTMVEGKIANYFEITNAISQMIKLNNFIENSDKTLSITPECKSAIDIVEKDLPLTIRDKSIKLCRKIMAQEIYEKENKVEIEKISNGYTVTCHVCDVDKDFMALSLFVPTQTQAEVLKEKFLTNPVAVYENLIDSIFSEDEPEDE